MALQVGELYAQLTMDSGPFDKQMSGLKGKMTKMGGAVAATLGGVVVGAVAALGGAMVGAVATANSYQKAMNSLEASTGATAEEMDSMGEAMKNVYARNFGESFQDVADTMAFAKQSTGAFGEELEYLTQDALMLRDTFGMEVSESLRGADTMMQQFGSTGTESMAMIANATQKGLNKNEDLIDTIEEYGVYYANAGMSAEDMFAQFENASAAGVRNLDLVGDSMKEFSIIMKEDGDKASDALSSIGLPAEKLQADFAAGGDKAKEAFQTIVGELGKIEDPLDRNAVGVELFGTKFEDLEADAILAMGNLNGTITGTVDTLDKINAVKYDSFGEAMAGIGRQLQVGLILPLGEKLLPHLNNFANWISGKIPMIVEFFTGLGTTVMGLVEQFRPTFESLKAAVVGFIDTFIERFQQFAPTMEQAKGFISTFVETVKERFNTIMAVVGPILELLLQKVMEVVSLIVAWWNSNGAELVANVTATFQGIWSVIQFIMPAILAIISMIFENIKGVISGALDIISGVFKIFAGLFTGNWSKMWDGVKQLVSGAFKFIWNLWQLMLYGKLIAGIKMLGTKGIGLFKNMWSSIKTGVGNFTNSVTSTILGFVGKVVGFFTNLGTRSIQQFNTLRTFGASIFGAIRSVIMNIISRLVTTATSRITYMKDKAVGIFNTLKNRASAIFEKVKTSITKPIETAKTTVLDVIEKIKSAFSNMKLKFPKFKLPKVSISTKKNALFGIDLPSFSVDWFKTGGIATGPAIAGVGEAGSEAIVPLAGSRMKPFSDAVGKQVGEMLGGINTGGDFGGRPIIVKIGEREIVKAISEPMNRDFAQRQKFTRRSVGKGNVQ